MIVVQARIVPPQPIIRPPVPAKPKKAPKVPKPKRIWDNYQEVGEVQKSDSIKFIIAAAVRDGVKYINIREFYLRKSDCVWRPGRDGITLPVIVPIKQGTELIKPYEGFRDMLHETLVALSTMELFDETKAIYYTPKEKTDDKDKRA